MKTPTTKTVWTPIVVSRPTTEGYTFLVVKAEYNERRDTFSFTVDGFRKEWYRRGERMFESWSEGCAYVRTCGRVLNDWA
jgi:hypothetical protein